MIIRTFILFVLFSLSSVLLAAVKSEKPNILILYADDLGFGDLTCYNPKSKISTPNLDMLASEGMRFTDAHSSSGICTPSRYALLTGRHHWRKFHGIVQSFGASAFSKERLTMPEMLKEKGYNTAAIGKWHLGWDWMAIRNKNVKPRVERHLKKLKRKMTVFGPDAFHWDKPIPDGPLAHGFDYYFGDTVINFPPYCWIENDKVTKAPDMMMDTKKWKKIKEGNWECRSGPMVSDWDPYENIPVTTKKGVDYIKKQSKAEKPFFLYFAYPSPHAPIIPNDKFDGKTQAGPYGDFVYETDDSIGQLLGALKESGQDKNTIVIFSADNGPEKYAYARSEKFDHWSAAPLRGLKRDIYEGGHRVPTIIKWPGRIPARKVCNELVSQIDFMATLADIVNYDLPANQAEDSHNLLSLITNKTEKSPRSIHIHNARVNSYAIRVGDWNLIDVSTGYQSRVTSTWEKKYGYTQDKNENGQLFNIKEDVGQKHNLIEKYPEKVKELRGILKKIRAQGYSAPRIKS